MKKLVLLGGQSLWRSMITSIWYERCRPYAYLYTMPDGYLFGRYLRDFGPGFGDRDWVSQILNDFVEGERELLFVDLGLQGEMELMVWAQESRYHQMMLTNNDLHEVVWFYWSSRVGDIQRVRGWYRGWLGWFDERRFQAESYYDLLVKIHREWKLKNYGWREFVSRRKGMERLHLQWAEQRLWLSFAQVVELSETSAVPSKLS